MMARLRRLWKQQPLLLAALCAAFIAFMFFGIGAVTEARHWKDPDRQRQELKAWMTPRYVSHSYRIPRDVLFPALGLEFGPDGNRTKQRITLGSIAEARDITLEELEEQISALAADVHQQRKDQDDD